MDFLKNFLSCSIAPTSHSTQEHWAFGLLYLADGSLGMVGLLNVRRDLEVVELPDRFLIIYA